MMSIRFRLIVLCFVLALLPAIPLSLLVQNLLDKSFNVGLSETIEDALESGIRISRTHLELEKTFFDDQASIVADLFPAGVSDSSRAAAILSDDSRLNAIDGILLSDDGARPPEDTRLPPALRPFAGTESFTGLVGEKTVNTRDRSGNRRSGLTLFESEDRSILLALWKPETSHTGLLLYKRIDPAFLVDADRVLRGNQIFAQLLLARERLSSSFFYPFVIIYGLLLILSLGIALLMAERLAHPIRRLSKATTVIADGDWNYRLRLRAGGEIGRLVSSFNKMTGRLDEQRRRLLDMEKMASWRDIARHLAHEIKNPLLPIRLTVQEMRDQYAGGERSYEEFLDDSVRVVEDELEHLQRLVKEFSAFAKLPGLSPETGSLEELVSDVAKLYPRTGCEIEPMGTMPEFPFDPDQMRRVLINLFDNAQTVIPEGARAAVRIRLTAHAGMILLRFADNGPGIPEDRLDKIFEPYYTTRQGGTGLGLAMVKNIVLLHGGSVEARNLETGGAEFDVSLPLAGPPAAAETAAKPEKP